MDWLGLLILAIVQGIAEFLPISSSGHLALGAHFLGLSEGQDELSIVLHGGTLGSILVFYHRRIIALLREDRRVIPMLIVGTIPAGILGIFLKKMAPGLLGINIMDGFPAALTAGLMLPITGLLMLSIPMLRGRQRDEDQLQEYQQLTYAQVFVIGCFQAFALLPGISRSGSTIFAGILTGLRSQAAATFSFLLAIPAIGGAMTLELKDVIENGSTTPIAMLLVGALVSFFVGVIALTLLAKFVNQGKLHWFAYWTIPVGLLATIQLLVEFMSSQIEM
ncbi:MAG: undecaprenyl-diphosphate phosphatase [Planctomycetaceae bacterium]|nr:undecaprenyl-diphosphate phosphatase [Planctomycetaceae bacterium]